MKKGIATVITLCCLLLLFNTTTDVVSAASPQPVEFSNEYFEKKFEEMFPEYIDLMNSSSPKSNIPEFSSKEELYSAIEQEINISETITRQEDDDIYVLALLTNGGYARAASVSTNAYFSGGTQTSDEWTNRHVYSSISSPGLITYTGGILGDSISYKKSGLFITYGHYGNAGVDLAYTGDVCFITRTSSMVQVQGVATGYVSLDGSLITMTKPTVLTIRLGNNTSTVSISFL